MTRGIAALLVLVACSGGGGSHDGGSSGGDGGGGSGDGGGGTVDAPGCAGQSMVLGTGADATCAFDVPLSFDPARINVSMQTSSGRFNVCHTLRETGCSGMGWYWSPSDHKVTLCTQTCDDLKNGGALVELVFETGCMTTSCGNTGCTQATGYCTHSTAATCCSGRCDGDSCGSGLWGPCPGMFGCFEGICQNGYCRCDPSDIQCGAHCFDPMTSNTHCGTCGNACSGGKTCQAGSCQCPSGFTDCNGTCVSLSSDTANCGMCNKMCRADQVCSSSNCECQYPLSECAGMCVNTTTNPLHCGSCNNACDPTSEVCTPFGSSAMCACAGGYFDCGNNGTCEDRMTDENNCGMCGRVCPGMKQCVMGDCI